MDERRRQPVAHAGVWLAGDLRLGADGLDPSLRGIDRVAAARGLDFVAVETPPAPGLPVCMVALSGDDVPGAVAFEIDGTGLRAAGDLDRPLPVVGRVAPAAAQGLQCLGQPTTWVLARDRSEAAIREGLRAGRTFVAAQPPAFGGARLFLQVADGEASVCVENGAGGTVRVLRAQEPVAEGRVSGAAAVQTFRIPAGGWFRAELWCPTVGLSAVTGPVRA